MGLEEVSEIICQQQPYKDDYIRHHIYRSLILQIEAISIMSQPLTKEGYFTSYNKRIPNSQKRRQFQLQYSR